MKDELDSIFESQKGTFDTEKTPENHQVRFMAKLHKQKVLQKKSRNWFRPISIAASIALVVCMGIVGFSLVQKNDALAKMPSEMQQSETFFRSSINAELQKLKAYKNPELQEIINETLAEIDHLEIQYTELKQDLSQSGNDSRVLAAMIANFQDRINLLEEVQETIKEITILKQHTNENIL